MGERISPEAVARDREQSRLRAAARRAANPEETNRKARKYYAENREHILASQRLAYGAGYDVLAARPFIGWDTEGGREFVGYVDRPPAVAHNAILFGCSYEPDRPIIGRRIGTEEILAYLFDVGERVPDAFHVGFYFNYDVNMILSDMPPRFLRLLAKYNRCHWQLMRFEWIPHKYFRVTRGVGKAKQTITIYDVWGFFLSPYTNALIKYGVANVETIRGLQAGKDERGRFTYLDIEYVLRYWQEEIGYFPLLMDSVRTACYDAGLFITAWHGPGALATYMLRTRGVKNWKSTDNPPPPEAQIAIQSAYAGGRFQPWRCGLFNHPIYTADINSAYIFACSLLPRLDNGRWRRIPAGSVDPSNLARFGVYYIAFDDGTDKPKLNRSMGAFQEIYPLFHRDSRNQVSWPHRTTGWYWTPEASIVATNPSARFLEAWIYDDDGTYPFEWVHTEFDKRLALQHENNPAEKIFKSALAAMYGAFAQRVGWDRKNRKPPYKHELAWAGFITSWCRAEMYKVGYECWRRGGLISIDTDGVTSSVPFDPEWLGRGVGEKLGQWKLEEFTGILYWQTGVYWLQDQEGNWTKAKTRGMPRGSVPVEAPLAALAESHYTVKDSKHAKMTRTITRFITFKEALNRHAMDEWQSWISYPYTSIMGGRGGSYIHIPAFCVKCHYPDVDQMHVLTHLAPRTVVSAPHELPWLKPQPDMPKHRIKLDAEDFIVLESDLEDNGSPYGLG